MKGLILYFSGTGNTKHIAEIIDKRFKEKGHETSLLPLDKNLDLNGITYDFLMIGCPKYMEYIPIFLIDMLKEKISYSQSEKKVVLFCTEAGPVKTSFLDYELVLREKNHNVIMTKSITMPNNYFLSKMYKPRSLQENIECVKKGQLKAIQLVDDFLEEKYQVERLNKFLIKILRKIGFKYAKKYEKNGKYFTISESCNGCGKCKRNCIVGNIDFLENKPVFNNKCIGCLKCINSCPYNAILYKNRKIHQYCFNKLKR